MLKNWRRINEFVQVKNIMLETWESYCKEFYSNEEDAKLIEQELCQKIELKNSK